ncbi:stage V sporulation protein E [Candidatus Gracilibacteria bacterium]|nr:MAG: stage V sporulation protein E [Candidatus Gracilibacteria bacterium]PIE85802.1 MAG: stage V sporulation protein E [Candidatus Gracilibacteria bacterium]
MNLNSKSVDYKLFFSILLLVIFGMIMVSSVSVYSSFRVTSLQEADGIIDKAYNYFYVLRNISHVFISMLTLGIITKIPYKFFEKNSKYILLLVLLLLVIVLLIGPSWKGARGWINLPILPFAIQPTEFLKLALILYLAYFFKKYKSQIGSFSNGLIPFMIIIGLSTLLVGLQPDFGTIMVIIPVSVIMFFIAGANIKHILIITILGFILTIGVYTSGKYDKDFPETRNKFSYITDRIDNFMTDNKTSIKNKTINYQNEQALIAIGSGGFSGLGFGQSIQKFGYLPEVQGDMIFSVIVEELGFIGAFILLSIYMYIGYRGFYIAKRVNDLFGKLVLIGITSWILMQSFINIGVNLNILPLTGITLPFLSYGGSSLLSLSIGLGIMLNISRGIEEKPKYKRLIRKTL